MKPLWTIFRLVWRADRWTMTRGIALAVVVLVMGVALLGLSGWFIVGAGAAGLAGTGAIFDVFRPSAGVRFLALGRTAARYGERLLTHDATLKALAVLRARLLAGIARAPFDRMRQVRGAQVLNRLTADVDALDGVALRVVIPVVAAVLTLGLALVTLSWLVDPAVALWSVLSLAIGAGLALALAARRSARPSRLAQAMSQAFRVRLIDHLRGRSMLAFSGQLSESEAAVLAADTRNRKHTLEVARIERRAGALISASATMAAAGALLIGAEMARSGTLAPSLAALGFFATLALAETVAPLRRGVAEIGAMREAARRVTRMLDSPVEDGGGSYAGAEALADLALQDVTILRPGAAAPLLTSVTLSVAPGESLALVGRSGAGKSTLLNAIAGLEPVAAGTVLIGGTPLLKWSEHALRIRLGYLPQRSALVSGTIAQNLWLGQPEADAERMLECLNRVCLGDVVARLGGLEAQLGEGGRGLSGGEARRLTLARVLLRNPDILLLDEPTEGLDRDTANRVLDGIRQACPQAAILIAAHRAEERAWADQALALQ